MKRKEISEPERLGRLVQSFGGSHSQDFKGLALRMLEAGHSPKEVAALSGVSVSTLYDWVRDWNEKKKPA